LSNYESNLYGFSLCCRKKICVSRDGQLKAILLDNKPPGQGGGGGDSKAELLQIWNGRTLLKTYDLAELDKHKGVITNGGN
jgi:hypothetical protein